MRKVLSGIILLLYGAACAVFKGLIDAPNCWASNILFYWPFPAAALLIISFAADKIKVSSERGSGREAIEILKTAESGFYMAIYTDRHGNLTAKRRNVRLSLSYYDEGGQRVNNEEMIIGPLGLKPGKLKNARVYREAGQINLNIAESLSNDRVKNRNFLLSQLERYKTHPQAEQITSFCRECLLKYSKSESGTE